MPMASQFWGWKPFQKVAGPLAQVQATFHELTNQQGFIDHCLATASIGKITVKDVSSYFQLLPAQE